MIISKTKKSLRESKRSFRSGGKSTPKSDADNPIKINLEKINIKSIEAGDGVDGVAD